MDKKEQEKKAKPVPKNLKGDDYPFELEEEDYVEMVVVSLNCKRRLILKRESGIPHEEFLTMPNPLATEIGKLRDVVMTFKSASCLEQTIHFPSNIDVRTVTRDNWMRSRASVGCSLFGEMASFAFLQISRTKDLLFPYTFNSLHTQTSRPMRYRKRILKSSLVIW